MLKRLDESRFLSRRIQKLSNWLAQKRGIPVVMGIVLIVASLILQSLSVFAESDVLQLVGIVAHHVGVLIALAGLLLANPLGQ